MARRPKKITIDKSIAEGVAWWNWVGDLESKQSADEQESLRFQRADGAWPDDVKEARSAATMPGLNGASGVPIPARPMVSIPLLDEPFALAAAQVRAAHLSPNIHALSEDASDETATVLQDLYRSIERDSRASNVRNWSYDRAWWAGRGAYRVDKVYDPFGGHPFDQKIVIKRILDQSWVRLDPHAQEPDWSDGKRAMLGVPMSWASYKEKYPKSKIASFDDKMLSTLAQQDGIEQWVQGSSDETRTVIVAEDWRVECTYTKWVLLDNGDAAPENEIPEGASVVTGDAAQWKYEESHRVFWRTINCYEELEPEQEWDGSYIPLIPVIWRELQPHDGKREWIGVVSNAKGAVRLTNFGASGVVEMAVTEPKAPYQLDPRQIEGYEPFWNQSNLRNFPYLPAHAEKDGQRFERPARTQVDVSRLGPSMSLMTMGREFVQTATATFDPALGKQPTAHRSGVAIRALQGQTEESTSGGLDNLAQISMAYEALVILDLIPKVYDRPERIARVLDDENASRLVMFNAPFAPHPQTKRPQALPYNVGEDQQIAPTPETQQQVDDPNHPAKYINLNKGKYGVEITIGKSYKSRRQEGESEMGNLLQADPALMPIIGPEYFKYRGEPWALQVSSLLEKMRDHQYPFLKTDGQQPNAQQIQQTMAENQHLKGVVQQLDMEKQGKVVEQQGKAQVAQIQESAETERAHAKNATTLAAARITAAKASFDSMREAMEEAQALGQQQNFEGQQAALGRAHEHMMAMQDHQNVIQQADQQNAQAMQQADQGQQHAVANAAIQAAQPQPTNGNGAAE